jgi:hypothetical protein
MKAFARAPENRYARVQDFADALEKALLQQASVVEPSAKSIATAGPHSEEAPTLPSTLPAIIQAADAAALPPQTSVPVVPASPLSQTPTQKLARRKIPRRKVLMWGAVIGAGAAVTTATGIELATLVHGSSQKTGTTNVPQHHSTVTPQPFGTSIYSYSPNVSIPHAVFIVAWSPNGKRIASAWEDNTARVWDAVTGSDMLTAPYTGHSQAVRSVVWSPDGKLIASGSFDGTVKVWWAI